MDRGEMGITPARRADGLQIVNFKKGEGKMKSILRWLTTKITGKHWQDCDCGGAKFVQHIQEHLDPGDEVVCKICHKTVFEIVSPSSKQAKRERQRASDEMIMNRY